MSNLQQQINDLKALRDDANDAIAQAYENIPAAIEDLWDFRTQVIQAGSPAFAGMGGQFPWSHNINWGSVNPENVADVMNVAPPTLSIKWFSGSSTITVNASQPPSALSVPSWGADMQQAVKNSITQNWTEVNQLWAAYNQAKTDYADTKTEEEAEIDFINTQIAALEQAKLDAAAAGLSEDQADELGNAYLQNALSEFQSAATWAKVKKYAGYSAIGIALIIALVLLYQFLKKRGIIFKS